MRKQRIRPRQPGWLAVALLAWCLAVGGGGVTSQPAATPGPTIGTPVPGNGQVHYPDLVALPPDSLYFSDELLADGRIHRLLRFATTAWNAGEGPLELAGDPAPGPSRTVYQHLYDAAEHGTMVESRAIGLDLIYHPAHHHFHLESYATYELARIGQDGSETPTGQGGKQSSCVLDSERIEETGPRLPGYNVCELSRQGLSVGWGDTYSASLPDQWIDLGDSPLADGDYALRYTVDPLGQLDEAGRVVNNTATTRFTVRKGAIVDWPAPPRCALAGPGSGVAGTTVTLACSHFPDDATIRVYWDGWDPWDSAVQPVTTARSTGATEQEIAFQAPAAIPGGHLVTAVAYDREVGQYVSAAVIYAIEEGDLATPVPG
jgi:hypothetical protein